LWLSDSTCGFLIPLFLRIPLSSINTTINQHKTMSLKTPGELASFAQNRLILKTARLAKKEIDQGVPFGTQKQKMFSVKGHKH
jgi:hypothetical protein